MTDRTDLVVLTEDQLAMMRTDEGDRVIRHAGRHWRATSPGFFQPIHLLAKMQAAEVTRPALLCWGYRAALAEEDAHLARNSMPLYLIEDAATFGDDSLSRNRRSDLRRCRRVVEFRALRDPSLLVEQGYRVFMSAVRRLGYWRPLTEHEYRQRIERRTRHGLRLIIAGLVDGRLEGYLDSFAVDGTLYPEEIFISTESMRSGIGTGLYVETIQAGARAADVRAVCNGLHTPEDADLCHFKESLGFRVVRVPARVVMPAPVQAYLRARRPGTYYRLTGVMGEPPVGDKGVERGEGE